MITIYENFDGFFKETSDIKKDVWVNMINPNIEEIELVSNFFKVPSEFIKAATDDEERSRIDIEDDHHLVLVDVPIPSENGHINMFTTIPFGIIIGKHYIITVCINELTIMKDFEKQKNKTLFAKNKTRFVLQILHRIATSYLRYLRLIDIRSAEVERQLHKNMNNSQIIQLLDIKKSLVYFTTSLTGNEAVLEKLLRAEFIRHHDEEKELLEDVIIENKQAIEMSGIYSDILSSTMDAFSSIISNNLNIVMKFLAAMTIILTVPTMIGGFFGMNVPVPMSNNPMAFPILILLSIIICIVIALIMIKKKML